MQSCISLSSNDASRSVTKRKPHRQKATKVRLLGGCTNNRSTGVISTMSSTSCPSSLDSVDKKVPARKRNDTQCERNASVGSLLSDVNGNIIMPASQVSVPKTSTRKCMVPSGLCTSADSQSLSSLQSLIDSTTVPSANLNSIARQPDRIAYSSSGAVRKQTSRRKNTSKAKLPAVSDTAGTTARKRQASQAESKTCTDTEVKKVRRCTRTSSNDRFVQHMTTFVSEVSKHMVSACVEQTFSQLIHQGLLVSPYTPSLSVHNAAVLLPSQHSTVISCYDQTSHFLQPYIGSVFPANNCLSAFPSLDNRSITVFSQQNTISSSSFEHTSSSLQPYIRSSVSSNELSSAFAWNNSGIDAGLHCACKPASFFPVDAYTSAQVFAQSSGNLGLAAASVCLTHPSFFENATNSFSACFDAVSTAPYTGIGHSVTQSTNVADCSLTDLLNMSDSDIDMLLSSCVECSHELPSSASEYSAACSAASTNAAALMLDASSYRTNIPVCCSFVSSVTEVLGSGPLPLSDNPETMDELYHETFDNIGEESFQPDYLESDDETEVLSTVGTSVDAPLATNAGQSVQLVTGKKIVLKKPSSDKVSQSVDRRRKRPWKSSSLIDKVSSVCSASTSTQTSEVTILSEPVTEASVADMLAETAIETSATVDEVLEGYGSVLGIVFITHFNFLLSVTFLLCCDVKCW